MNIRSDRSEKERLNAREPSPKSPKSAKQAIHHQPGA